MDKLKSLLSSAPILRNYDPNLKITVTTDASGFAIGAVLSQEEQGQHQPVAFESRKMSPAEMNYAVHEKELLAVVHAIKAWRHYLEGQKFTVITDHQSLKYLNTQPTLTRRQAAWVELLQAYNFDIIYKPGKTNVVADALSRQANLTNIHIAADQTFLEKVIQGYIHDKEVQNIPDVVQKDKLYYFQERLCIPDVASIRQDILHEAHDTKTAGHLGIAKTTALVKRNFYWPKMNHDIKNYVISCEFCQKNKPSQQSPAGLLQTIPTPAYKWEQITMDFIVQLPPTEEGYDAIVIFVDRFTKTIKAEPTHTNATAPDIAQIFFKTIFRNYGLPRVIISDRDPKFMSLFWKSLFASLDTKLALSTAFHPQTDGQTERANRTLEQILRNYISYKQDDWDKFLITAEFAYNNSIQASTGFSPFKLLYGQDAPTPSTITSQQGTSQVPAAQAIIADMHDHMELAKQHLQRAQQNQAQYANKKRRDEQFDIGDQVLLSTSNLRLASLAQQPSRKFQPRYIGPYKILEKISPVAYKLQLPQTFKIHPVFHISLLKRFHEDTEFNRYHAFPESLIVDDHQEYEVEKILDNRTCY